MASLNTSRKKSVPKVGKSQPEEKSLLLSTLHYRKVVGFMGLLLVPVLWLVNRCHFQDSISAFVVTPAGFVLVGTMCAIGVFLCCYLGYELGDHVGSFIAGVAAIGVGLFPTQVGYPNSVEAEPDHTLHSWAAAIFFLAITYLCLFQFTRSGYKPEDRTREKRWRNVIYKACGGVLILCLLGLLVNALWETRLDNLLAPLKPLLLIEFIAITTFGFAWLVKGEGLLWDKGRNWWTGELPGQ